MAPTLQNRDRQEAARRPTEVATHFPGVPASPNPLSRLGRDGRGEGVPAARQPTRLLEFPVSAFTSRPYAGDGDFLAILDFARNQSLARLPNLTYWQPGDVVWRLLSVPGYDPPTWVRLWFDQQGLAAVAFFEPPLVIDFDVRVSLFDPEPLYEEVLAWAEEHRRRTLAAGGSIPKAYEGLGADTITTAALESDTRITGFLLRSGYAPGDRHEVRYSLDLAAWEPSGRAPAPLRVRSVAENDLDERVDLHRDAWSVWGLSRFNRTAYERIRATTGYDETLDLVLDDGTGRLLSYCIAWADQESGIGVFEPVGTRPEFAGRGLGRFAIMEGLLRMKERGLHTALIGTASINTRALRLYPKCGFAFAEKQQSWVKRLA